MSTTTFLKTFLPPRLTNRYKNQDLEIPCSLPIASKNWNIFLFRGLFLEVGGWLRLISIEAQKHNKCLSFPSSVTGLNTREQWAVTHIAFNMRSNLSSLESFTLKLQIVLDILHAILQYISISPLTLDWHDT